MGRITPSSGKTTEVDDSFERINKIPQTDNVVKINAKLKTATLKNLLLIGNL